MTVVLQRAPVRAAGPEPTRSRRPRAHDCRALRASCPRAWRLRLLVASRNCAALGPALGVGVDGSDVFFSTTFAVLGGPFEPQSAPSATSARGNGRAERLITVVRRIGCPPSALALLASLQRRYCAARSQHQQQGAAPASGRSPPFLPTRPCQSAPTFASTPLSCIQVVDTHALPHHPLRGAPPPPASPHISRCTRIPGNLSLRRALRHGSAPLGSPNAESHPLRTCRLACSAAPRF